MGDGRRGVGQRKNLSVRQCAAGVRIVKDCPASLICLPLSSHSCMIPDEEGNMFSTWCNR